MVSKIEINLIWILTIMSKKFSVKKGRVGEAKHTGEKQEGQKER